LRTLAINVVYRRGIAEVTLRHLRYLIALAEELHFRRAAERLHLTQPALSHQIRQLEEILGVRLFDRDGRHVGLTQAGDTLVVDARRLLGEVESAVDRARRAGGAGAPLKLCHSPSIRRILIPALMAELRRRGPAIDVLWIERSEEAVGAELADGRYDVVLGRFPLAGPGLEHDVLLWERPGVYLAQDDPLVALDEVPLTALAGRRIRTVRRESVPRHFEATMMDLKAAGLHAGIEPIMSYGNWASDEMLREVSEGVCVVIGLASADGTLPRTRVKPLAPPASPIPLTISWRKNDPRAEVTEFIELAHVVADAIDAPWLTSEQPVPELRVQTSD
jgi:DNA-binding transcriptional LysR family regulator